MPLHRRPDEPLDCTTTSRKVTAPPRYIKNEDQLAMANVTVVLGSQVSNLARENGAFVPVFAL